MEFLLQMFAEFLGSPSMENESIQKNETEEKNVKPETIPVQNESTKEESVIFGFMQFH